MRTRDLVKVVKELKSYKKVNAFLEEQGDRIISKTKFDSIKAEITEKLLKVKEASKVKKVVPKVSKKTTTKKTTNKKTASKKLCKKSINA